MKHLIVNKWINLFRGIIRFAMSSANCDAARSRELADSGSDSVWISHIELSLIVLRRKHVVTMDGDVWLYGIIWSICICCKQCFARDSGSSYIRNGISFAIEIWLFCLLFSFQMKTLWKKIEPKRKTKNHNFSRNVIALLERLKSPLYGWLSSQLTQRKVTLRGDSG